MRLFHAFYAPEADPALWIWGESDQARERKPRGVFPFAMTARELRATVPFKTEKTRNFTALLPPYPSSPLIGDVAGAAPGLQAFKIPAVRISRDALLRTVPEVLEARVESGMFYAADFLYWASVLRFALHLAVTQKYLPALETNRAVWRPVLLGEDKARFAQYVQGMPPVCRALSANGNSIPEFGAEELVSRFVQFAIHQIIHAANTVQTQATSSQEYARTSGVTDKTARVQILHDRWLAELQQPEDAASLHAKEVELEALQSDITRWTSPLLVRVNFDYRLAFRLEEPTQKKDYWFVRYFLQKENEPTLLLPLGKLWKGSRLAVQLFSRDLATAVQNALVSLTQAGKIDERVETSLLQSQPSGYRTDTQGAWQFLNTKAWMLQDAGYGILFPSWWARGKSDAGLSLKAKATGAQKKAFTGAASGLSIDFDWQLAIGKEEITYEELMALARLKAPLVKFRGKWVELRPEQIQAASEFWKSGRMQKGDLSDLLKMLSGISEPAGELPLTSVEASGWVSQFLHQFHENAAYKLHPVPEAFCGKLRDYQQRGFSWLRFMQQYGLGSCLADDMGLGKTIQAIALILACKQEANSGAVLLICPTSVVGNWERELQRFGPSLRVMVHHGVSRKKGAEFADGITGYDVVLSSYSLLLRDIETLGEIRWHGVILDEAQNIKNADAKQARAARSLQASYRGALTGTPVENNIGELWSIFEFLNPGLLGTRTEFKQRFFTPIHTSNDLQAAELLKKITGPFVLRRLKTDPEISTELPRKMEMKTFCNLTREQASLYAAALKTLEKDLEEAEGIERRGKILAALMKLKQICNHPAHFLKDGSPLEGRSGKLSRLGEMLEEVLSIGERALIFTQFVEMGDLLRGYLQNYFGREVAFLHGGVPRNKREEMVQRFNNEPDGPPLFLLSLKAGGTGLNLTAANHVFHFDRWWNPAVENQATDRAYRIGQKKNVQVHKMVCVGTLEERIDAMIESKKAIAESIVGTGEAWLTELSTEEIKSLVALGKEAVSV